MEKMGYTLIITEKPKASQKIAEALADTKLKKETINGVPYYRIVHDKKEIVVGCAVGHLFSLAPKKGQKWTYPVFDIEWKPIGDVSKGASYTKKYSKALATLAEKASAFIVATDYDIEGEVIGLNCVRFVCKKKDAGRMKFSTLTKQDLVKSFSKISPTLDWGLANAGETRHILDWFYGINLSRALTDAFKAKGTFKIMSAGRVQAPALKILVVREKEITSFIPRSFWQIELHTEKENSPIVALHVQDQFWEKEKAEAIYKTCNSQKKVHVVAVKKTQFQQSPPTPFDLTSLQVEAYRVHKISPKETLAIAQELYINGYISYPRTSSQKLPKEIGYPTIIKDICRQARYKELHQYLPTELIPHEGKKEDSAHPAIYPTGIAPKGITEQEDKIYDLVVRRFLATFASPALREVMEVILRCKEEDFCARGITTKERGWHLVYGPYATYKEEELPAVKEGEELVIKKVLLLQKETQPPHRFTESSIIKELEKKNLGTKATRAHIIETLYQRGYIDGKPAIHATELGNKTCEILEKYCPVIVDEELTRHFEIEMEEIRLQKRKKEEVLLKAKELLIKELAAFTKKKEEVGEALLSAFQETRTQATTLGNCQECKKGMLQLRRGKFGMFVACTEYPSCTITFSLPSSGLIQPAKVECKECLYPMVKIIRRGKRPQDVCINQACPSKKSTAEAERFAQDIVTGKVEKKCPKCTKDLVIRKSIYGQFLGCSGYPACRYTEKLPQQK